jgi:hypothetical protein
MPWFVYVKSAALWLPPVPEPQVIHDEGLAKHLIKEKKLNVVARFVLTEHEASAPIAELVARYPYQEPKE